MKRDLEGDAQAEGDVVPGREEGQRGQGCSKELESPGLLAQRHRTVRCLFSASRWEATLPWIQNLPWLSSFSRVLTSSADLDAIPVGLGQEARTGRAAAPPSHYSEHRAASTAAISGPRSAQHFSAYDPAKRTAPHLAILAADTTTAAHAAILPLGTPRPDRAVPAGACHCRQASATAATARPPDRAPRRQSLDRDRLDPVTLHTSPACRLRR